MHMFNFLAVVSPVEIGQEIAYMHKINHVYSGCKLYQGDVVKATRIDLGTRQALEASFCNYVRSERKQGSFGLLSAVSG